MPTRSHERVRNCLAPNCRCRSVMPSWCSRASMALPAGKDLTEEVLKRTGKGLEWAAAQAERAIHDNDVERSDSNSCDEYPALLSWRDE